MFISWIKEYVTSPRFSIALNSTLVGYFEERKGLSQEGPSLSLFVCSSHGGVL
jgi:hypothetical protein